MCRPPLPALGVAQHDGRGRVVGAADALMMSVSEVNRAQLRALTAAGAILLGLLALALWWPGAKPRVALRWARAVPARPHPSRRRAARCR